MSPEDLFWARIDELVFRAERLTDATALEALLDQDLLQLLALDNPSMKAAEHRLRLRAIKNHPRQDAITRVVTTCLANPSFPSRWFLQGTVVLVWPDVYFEALQRNPSILLWWLSMDRPLRVVAAQHFRGNVVYNDFNRQTTPLAKLVLGQNAKPREFPARVQVEVGHLIARHGFLLLPPGSDEDLLAPMRKKYHLTRPVAYRIAAEIAERHGMASSLRQSVGDALCGEWQRAIFPLAIHLLHNQSIADYRNAAPEDRFDQWIVPHLAFLRDLAALLGMPMPTHLLSTVFP